ncbi:DUF4279 domain-containing protein [Marinobacterium iners]|jgi:hypothetical protein|uniref:DUF4279 domain-containing protein n=1 Tax=Marinobacterium iners DSM 11526 TaxID=1122198 RepID=A0A1H4H565_9GAMM|nr:DUF4279 domain-containing protein [Marinobacterium iners]SEB16208.1 protein of unknown function [Marinobacterium iners DSM 11526]
MEDNECRVYFGLYGDDFDPKEITSILGIDSTSTKRRGENLPNSVPKFSSWILSTANAAGDSADVYELSSEIVNKLQPKKDLIIEVMRRFRAFSKLQVVLSISIKENVSTPAIGFDVDTIKFLGEIGAFIDIDTYKE